MAPGPGRGPGSVTPGAGHGGDSLVRGTVVGRFVVLGRLGAGGMGEVYAAYDPELDRKVAVKLLRAALSGSADGRALLLREAQATAKLQHPNVVVIYDVGTLGERVFIAMELIEGQTLRAWVNSTRPSWREVLAVFMAAGRGLAAAHDAGIVHRDFKPDNVMITRDGQVRVMDFGLARAISRPSAARSAVDADGDLVVTPAATPYLDVELTRAGARVGTPAYMALEQILPGLVIDTRTDQFSFCVTLYEALYGERPFGADDPGLLKLHVAAEKVRPPPPHCRVPPWIRRILLRGLRSKREERFPTMAVLLAALADDPAVRRRKAIAVASAVGLVAVAALGAHRLDGAASRHRLCDGGPGRLTGTWEVAGTPSGRRERIHRAFMESGAAFAATAFDGAARLLDQYAERWAASYAEACESTNLRGEQSTEVLDLRMGCLNERLGNLRALTDVFAQADKLVVEYAASAAGALPSLDACADVELLRSVAEPPSDPDNRRRVEQVRQELARFIAERDSGQCMSAAARADALVATVDATGYEPLRAEVLVAAGRLGDQCADAAQGIERLKAGYNAAIDGRDDRVAAEAAVAMPVSLGRLG
ncbi:MAG TPA: serine/threonine-protein kinase, partial [Polyangia bacterium]|nr:serine/threonine-protein kinase [Polyangia bacterium]